MTELIRNWFQRRRMSRRLLRDLNRAVAELEAFDEFRVMSEAYFGQTTMDYEAGNERFRLEGNIDRAKDAIRAFRAGSNLPKATLVRR